jgi:hypothetical protein
LPAAKRGPHTNGLSPPNGRLTPVIRKLGDEVLYAVAVVPGLGGGGHLTARPGLLLCANTRGERLRKRPQGGERCGNLTRTGHMLVATWKQGASSPG